MKINWDDQPAHSGRFDVHVDMADDGPEGSESARVHVLCDGTVCEVSVDKMVNREHVMSIGYWATSQKVGIRFLHLLELSETASDMIWLHAKIEEVVHLVNALLQVAVIAATNDDHAHGQSGRHVVSKMPLGVPGCGKSSTVREIGKSLMKASKKKK